MIRFHLGRQHHDKRNLYWPSVRLPRAKDARSNPIVDRLLPSPLHLDCLLNIVGRRMSGLFLQQLVANSVCFRIAVCEVGGAMSSPINNSTSRAVQTAGRVCCWWDPMRSPVLSQENSANKRWPAEGSSEQAHPAEYALMWPSCIFQPDDFVPCEAEMTRMLCLAGLRRAPNRRNSSSWQQW